MAKQTWKPGNMLNPVPAVMVSVADKDGKPNIITIAWAGTVCTNPPMVSISVRPERYSYHMIEETGEFVVIQWFYTLFDVDEVQSLVFLKEFRPDGDYTDDDFWFVNIR